MKKLFRIIIGFLSSFLPEKMADFLMWPVATRVLGLSYREKVLLKDGFYMVGSMEDILSREILFRGPWRTRLWEKETLNVLSKLSRDSSDVVIAGAHMGYLVLFAAYHSEARIHSFEPVKWLFDRASENISLNPALYSRIHLENLALGEKSGTIELYEEGIRSSNVAYSGGHVQHHNIISVPMDTLDNYSSKCGIYPKLILLDVEGYEWYVLNGSEACLSHKPTLILEVSPRVLSHTDITPEMIFSKLASLGYRVEFLDDQNLEAVPLDEKAKDLYMKKDYVNILASYQEDPAK